ncbi:unnamed protein product [Clonostachys chloroleuca]|uniref:Uncharacterized protein n=1 Tax=Clonostachys chloroleuca TaxID=1926264 RepID=A0AA35QD72_9HYPO|nr:unnamed protein product [Clonostachys chloroleuca]
MAPVLRTRDLYQVPPFLLAKTSTTAHVPAKITSSNFYERHCDVDVAQKRLSLSPKYSPLALRKKNQELFPSSNYHQ